MKKLVRLTILIAITLAVGVAMAADVGTATENAGNIAAAATNSQSILLWFQQNLAAIFGIALAISELLGASPWFKGNGILDSVIKSLKFLAGKTGQV